MITLKDVMPYEFVQQFDDTRAYKMKDVKVVKEHSSATDNIAWPGTHKNVYYWAELANGYAVAFNENPAIGWSFPVKKL